MKRIRIMLKEEAKKKINKLQREIKNE